MKLCCRLLAPFLLTLGLPSTALPVPDRPEPLEILEKAFRQGRPEALWRIVGTDDKVYVTSSSLGLDAGYYSVDQLSLVMQEVFRARATLSFNFLKAANPPPEFSRRVALARWVYRKGRSREQTAEIAFTLIRRKGGWYLKEIRDVP